MNDDHLRELFLRELFNDMRDEPLPAESLARVRMAVAARVQARRRVLGMRWKVAGVLAVAGCLAAVMLRPRAVGPVQSPPIAQPVVAVQQSAPAEAPPPIVRKRVRMAARPVSGVQKAPEAVEGAGGAHEIRIENPYDPDVVIVFIGG